ncbi:hypothetical protein H4W80_001890 [Nonomuraea angiospora]|uniref:eCIS core domain-containing protein n=2 Tax=Nonomuraea angiospora TaxID=46172 RepID=A0ABR9LTL6_9ACTN|nr:hypothetical protein [Nonomuraea angiospora]
MTMAAGDRRAESARASAPVPAAARRELARRGEPLDRATRTAMEQRFGQDLSQVRVHSDGPAGRSARELGARAYTVGERIVFGPGRFAPHTPDGRHLLAHELAHVIQQRGGAGPRPTRHAGLEAAAHAAADAMAHESGPVAVGGSASVGLAMAEETGGPASPEDVEALGRLREFQDAADLRATELMEGVVRKSLARWEAGQAAKTAKAEKEGKPPPVDERTPEERREAAEGSIRGDVTVTVGYAVDEQGNLHELVTTSKGSRRKLVDLGPSETWVKAVRLKKQQPEAPDHEPAGPAPAAKPAPSPAPVPVPAPGSALAHAHEPAPESEPVPESGVVPKSEPVPLSGVVPKTAPASQPGPRLVDQHEGGTAEGETSEADEPKRRRTAEQARKDAEARLVAHAAKHGLKLIAVGASSLICPHCAAKLGLAGATTGTGRAKDPLREHVPANLSPALEAIKKLPRKPPRPEPVVEQRRPARPEAPPPPKPRRRIVSLPVPADADDGILQQAQTQPKAPKARPKPEAPQAAPAPEPAKPPAPATTAPKTPTTPAPAPAPAPGTAPKATEATSKSTRTTTVARNEGSLTLTRSKDTSTGTFDEQGRLQQGTRTAGQASAGLVAGPEGFGGQGAASAQRTTAYGNGFTTTKSVAGNARVVVKATRVEATEPPAYQLMVTVTIGASGTVGGGAGRKGTANASLSVTGSVTGTFVHRFTEEETRRYLGDLARDGSGGAEQELRIVNLVARGGVDDARQLLTTLAAPLSAAEAARLGEGDQASLEARKGLGGSLGVSGAGRSPVGAEVSYSRSRSLKRTVARRGGAVLVTVEVVSESAKSIGASGSSGAVSGGLSYGRTTSEGRAVTFRLNPGDPDYQNRFDRILAVDGAAELAALAAADPTRVAGTETGSGWSTTLTPKVGVAGLEASISTTHSFSEKTVADETGTHRLFAGATGGGLKAGAASGPQLEYQTEQAVTAAVGPGNKATGDVSTTTSETDLGVSARALASAADQSPIASALKLATGGSKLLQSRTEVIGMKLSDDDFAAIASISREPGRWNHAFRGRIASFQDWQRLGRRIAAAGGDREAMSRALAEYASDNDGASDAVQAVVRPQGQAEGGVRYDWPAELAKEREAFETIVVGDRVAQLRARAAAGAFEEAQAGLKADNLRLDRAARAITAASEQFTDVAAVAEMLRRIGDRQTEIRAELRRLKTALAPAPAQKETVGPPPAPAPDADAMEERNARIRSLIPALLTLRDQERAVFAEVRKELEHPPWYRGPDVIAAIQSLNKLKPVYTQWDPLVDRLREVFRERGEDGSRADGYAPDRRTYEALRRHPELTKYG